MIKAIAERFQHSFKASHNQPPNRNFVIEIIKCVGYKRSVARYFLQNIMDASGAFTREQAFSFYNADITLPIFAGNRPLADKN
ncbi:hypothetical protein IR120_04935 [Muribacter muris]|uniref:hypothetical protein n=1 Tax=Muribacter muris TaxID=67855 RepID=UPI001883BEFA|nr:hypothetical protein [Muribacter muris]MBF0784815.1 hypothetical protein [Muribacter muris]